mmetsp:Transcript_44087/g.104322  ORF Transcript_44087/g.104322 Transcript_44087/m.104322 type:complete len:425 (+) Transcript_44087:75-1349(+)
MLRWTGLAAPHLEPDEELDEVHQLIAKLRKDHDKKLAEHALSIKEVYNSIHGKDKGCLIKDLQEIINKMKGEIDKQAATCRQLEEDLRFTKGELQTLKRQSNSNSPAAGGTLLPFEPPSAKSMGPAGMDANVLLRLSRQEQKLSTLQQDVEGLTDNLKQVVGLSSNSSLDLVQFKDLKDYTLEADFRRVEEEVTVARRSSSLAVIKSGYLAVACTEASDRDKARILQVLQEKEGLIASGRLQEIGPLAGILGKDVEPPPTVVYASAGVSSWSSGRGVGLDLEDDRSPLPLPTTGPSSGTGVGNISPRIEPDAPASPPEEDSPRQELENYEEFEVTVQKTPGAVLGLEIDPDLDQYLGVERVLEGLVDNWNRANPSQAVCPGHGIVAVNGVYGETETLLAELKSEQVTLKVHRDPENWRPAPKYD